MTPPARLQPVQAWAIVDRAGSIRQVHLEQSVAEEKCHERNASAQRVWGDNAERFSIVPVTVRAWAPPNKKKVTR